MKKSFKMKIAGRDDARVVEAIKHEIRQYMKREKRKALPEDMDYWDFDCKFGKTDKSAQEIKPSEITSCIDSASQNGDDEFYIEILAKAVIKTKKDTGEIED